MSEDRDFADDHAPEDHHGPEPVRTGLARVDAVIGTVEGLEGRPLEEHVGVFERAHEQLRSALDAPQTDPV